MLVRREQTGLALQQAEEMVQRLSNEVSRAHQAHAAAQADLTATQQQLQESRSASQLHLQVHCEILHYFHTRLART